MRIARIASLLALAAGITLGAAILFAPFYYGCSSGAVAPGQTPGPPSCGSASLVQTQRELFPLPVLAIAAWSLAPVLAVIGVHGRRSRLSLIIIAMLVELTGIVSLGGGFLFTLLTEPLLLITFVAARRERARMG